jgi:hypothetical protein
LNRVDFGPENSDVVAAADDDDIWGDASDSPGHESTLDREWSHRKSQFHKVCSKMIGGVTANDHCYAVFINILKSFYFYSDGI